jgi:ubiquitin-protein ligase
LKFSESYPLAPPEAYFECGDAGTFPHPNVRSGDGMVCLPIFKSSWRPATKIIQILQLMHEFLDHPNVNDPFNGDMAREYRSNRERYNQKVRDFCAHFQIKGPE